MDQTRKKVFISHSSIDQPIVEAVDTVLRTGLGLPDAAVFYSSIEDISIPTGATLMSTIRDELLEATLVIQISFEYRPAIGCCSGQCS